MSFSEFCVIAVIGMIILQPCDIKFLLRSLRGIRSMFFKLKDNIMDVLSINDIDNDMKNFYSYLEKIHNLGETYTGERDVRLVKKYYLNLLKESKNE